MTSMTIVQARNNLASVINRVNYGRERIVFARRGKPVAVLVSPDDLALLQRMEDAEDLREARRVLRQYERNPESFVSLDDYKRAQAKA